MAKNTIEHRATNLLTLPRIICGKTPRCYFLASIPKSLRITLPMALKNPGIPSIGFRGGFNIFPPDDDDADDDDAEFELLVEYAALVACL
eukprot:CAMPEP_0196146336 /NCGR_PEP_ID=MMETSP0910-20130528/22773_1 /TAXON_ID=49265 /ORGANISM="Thalassiosira rotula, Strain GSO102" /LENGTH=89 /DNA_ID=CAMNT_0041408507 /DNA_START=281 /DNA_END=550 /DNA_ORIENTATION=-